MSPNRVPNYETPRRMSLFEKVNMLFTVGAFLVSVIAVCLIPWGVWSLKTVIELERTISDERYVNRTNYSSDMSQMRRDYEANHDDIGAVRNELAGLRGALHNTVGTKHD